MHNLEAVTCRLFCKDHPVKKQSLHPAAREANVELQLLLARHRGHFGNVIYSIFLFVALGNQPSFISIQTTIRLEFDGIHLFTANEGCIGRCRNEIPCLISFKSYYFLSLHLANKVLGRPRKRCGNRDRVLGSKHRKTKFVRLFLI